MSRLTRRIGVAAAAALVVGPLATVSPTVATSAPESAPGSSARGYTLVMQCSGSRPYRSTGFMTITHRFPLPSKGKWKGRDPEDSEIRYCKYRNPRAKMKISFYRGAGSWKSVHTRFLRAKSRPGFKKVQHHRHGVRFDQHANKTRIAEFTFLNGKGVRQHVRLVGDKYTLLWVRSSHKAWRNGIGKTANRAHRGMNRIIGIAM